MCYSDTTSSTYGSDPWLFGKIGENKTFNIRRENIAIDVWVNIMEFIIIRNILEIIKRIQLQWTEHTWRIQKCFIAVYVHSDSNQIVIAWKTKYELEGCSCTKYGLLGWICFSLD